MNWIKGWLIKLIAPKFIKDKVGQLLGILSGYLVAQNVASVAEAQALSEVLLPILVNVVTIVAGLALNISATEKAKKD